jgi:serine/threonine-protein kinase RsbW
MVLPADPLTPRRARTAVAERFGHHARCSDILVCVSEAVTNAVLHAGTTVRIVVREVGSALRFEVTDADPTVPVARNPGPTTPTGRGLLLIDRLATRWGIEPRRDGKTLWFEVAA